MLIMILNFLFLTLNLHANVCEYLFVKEDVHLSKADQRIEDLSKEYSNWFQVSLKNMQFLNPLKGQRVALISLRSSKLFQHYKIEKMEVVVESVGYSPQTNNPVLYLKNGESIPWVRIQKLFIDPNKLSSSVFNESEKHFKLYHYSKRYRQNCIGCVEQGKLIGNNYVLNKPLSSYNKYRVVFYDHAHRQIRSLKNTSVVESATGVFKIKDPRTGVVWKVPHYEVGFIGLHLPHGH